MRNKKRPGKQPSDRWEKVLEDVTVKPRKGEVLFDPFIIDTLLVSHSPGYLCSVADDSRLRDEKERLIERLRSIVKAKFEGRPRECLLLLLSGCDSYTEIGKKLAVSRDTVRRSIEQATLRLKDHVTGAGESSFPSTKRQRLRTALLPIDTSKERRHFQEFLNTHPVAHLALASGPVREVLVVYKEVG